ncbi:MAG: TolC family protein [Methylotenera sp.]
MIKSNKSIYKPIYKAILVACLAAIFSGCNFLQYNAKPIDPIANAVKFEAKNPASDAFNQYLMRNGYTANQLPLKTWGVDELTYSALFFHPNLDVARAQWRVAESAELSAAGRPIPNLNANVAHSNQANEDIKPFAFGLSIDIPLETANKREIRIENARHLSQAAKLEIAQTAWQLRNQVAQSFNEYQFNQQQIKLLTDEQARRQEIVAIYQKRVSLGAASNVELSTVKLQLQTTTLELNTANQNRLVLQSKLASNLGLPLVRVTEMNLINDNVNHPAQPKQVTTSDLQTIALLNRLDIRIALERYAAVEAKLKLEIAKQYPDLVISPGYAYEFGDRVWSLGLSGLLTLLNKNKLAIAEATQLREVEAAQFNALQEKVISEANIGNAQLLQANSALENQQQLLMAQQNNTQRMLSRFSAGEIDRLELTYAKLENNIAEKNLALAYFQYKTTLNQLENTLQKPLSANIDIEKLKGME